MLAATALTLTLYLRRTQWRALFSVFLSFPSRCWAPPLKMSASTTLTLTPLRSGLLFDFQPSFFFLFLAILHTLFFLMFFALLSILVQLCSKNFLELEICSSLLPPLVGQGPSLDEIYRRKKTIWQIWAFAANPTNTRLKSIKMAQYWTFAAKHLNTRLKSIKNLTILGFSG